MTSSSHFSSLRMISFWLPAFMDSVTNWQWSNCCGFLKLCLRLLQGILITHLLRCRWAGTESREEEDRAEILGHHSSLYSSHPSTDLLASRSYVMLQLSDNCCRQLALILYCYAVVKHLKMEF